MTLLLLAALTQATILTTMILMKKKTETYRIKSLSIVLPLVASFIHSDCKPNSSVSR